MTVTESWQTITNWLGERLPAAIADLNPPASEADLQAVESTLGLELPADLREWLRLNDGMGHGGSFGRVLPPLHNPIPCEQILKVHSMHLSIERSVGGDADELDRVTTAPAGTPAWRYPRAFVPFAEDGGGVPLFVDLREGQLRGCVGEWNPEMGGFSRPLWPGIAAMLVDVAQSLTTGNPVFGSYDDPPEPDRREPKEPELIDDDTWLHWI